MQTTRELNRETIINQVKTMAEIIKDLLIEKEEYRDSDTALIAKIWWKELQKARPVSYETVTAKDFLFLMKDDKLSSAESIRRARQKVQELYPETRGKKYKQRHNAADEMATEIKKVA